MVHQMDHFAMQIPLLNNIGCSPHLCFNIFCYYSLTSNLAVTCVALQEHKNGWMCLLSPPPVLPFLSRVAYYLYDPV